MSTLTRITLKPARLDLVAGPRSSPYGEITAECRDAAGDPVEVDALEWTLDNSAFSLEPTSDPRRVTVGSTEGGQATVTARDPKSGVSGTATVWVGVLDGPMRGGGPGGFRE